MDDKLVTVASYYDPLEAHITKIQLANEGIESVLGNEFSVGMKWICANAFGGVQVMVRESDRDRAVAVLSEENRVEHESIAKDACSEAEEDVCPSCGSDDIYYERFRRGLVLLSLLLINIPLPFFKGKWKCSKCGFEWDREKLDKGI